MRVGKRRGGKRKGRLVDVDQANVYTVKWGKKRKSDEVASSILI